MHMMQRNIGLPEAAEARCDQPLTRIRKIAG